MGVLNGPTSRLKTFQKNSSTVPTFTRFISKSCQANLINELPLQLCPSWPRSPGKGRKQAYTYVHITKVFEPRGQKNFARRFRGNFVFSRNLVAFFENR